MTKTRVLFLCTGNSARSQMAEAFLRAYAGESFEVASAGLEPTPINPFTVRVMEEAGISMLGHRSKPLHEFVGKAKFDYLVTVCDRAGKQCPFFPGSGERIHASFDDPAAQAGSEEQKLRKFREVRDAIEAWITQWLERHGIAATKGS
jgi:arsenate reductase